MLASFRNRSASSLLMKMQLLTWNNAKPTPGPDTRPASSMVVGAGCRGENPRLRRREKNVLDFPFYRPGVCTYDGIVAFARRAAFCSLASSSRPMRTSPQVPIVSPQRAHLTRLSLVAWSGTMNLLLPQLRHLSGAGSGMALAVHSAQRCCWRLLQI